MPTKDLLKIDPCTPDYEDRCAMAELELFIDNDAELYRQQATHIFRNLARKARKGTYDPNLSPRLFMYLVDAGARRYWREFGDSDSQAWHKVFSKPDRMRLAVHMARIFENEYDLGNYDSLK